MSFEEEEESFEHTLLVVREVAVFKIPPRSTSGGYKCGEWLQSDKIWSGRLRVVSCKDRCEIRLEDPNSSELFAACFVPPGQRETSVETVLDSSRYFVLKIEDGTGKHAFIGLGFAERNEAFDFNVALSDHDKYVKRENEKEVNETGDDSHIDVHPAVQHRLKVNRVEIFLFNFEHFRWICLWICLVYAGRWNDKNKCEAQANEWDWDAVSSGVIRVGKAQITEFKPGSATRVHETQVASAATSQWSCCC